MPASLPPPLAPDELEGGPVLITGLCGRLGRAVLRQLHRERLVVGVDRRPFRRGPKDVEHHAIDLRRTKVRDVFRGRRFAAVVHLGVLHDPHVDQAQHHAWNVTGFARLLDCVARYGVPKLVVLSSANVYGPSPDNPQFLDEDTPLLGGARFPEVRDLVEVDMMAQSFFWKRPEIETVVLRPAHIVGAVRNAPSNYLRLPIIPTIAGFDPMVQVMHQADVVSAIVRALRPGVRGIFNLAGPPPVALSRLVSLRKRPRLPVPHGLMSRVLGRMFRMRFSSFPEPELDFIRFVCMVDDRRARELLGHDPRHDLASTLEALDDP